jgi:hypothetical protein
VPRIKRPAKSREFAKFTKVMDALIAVPYSELKATLEAEKEAKKQRKPKAPSSVSHDSAVS